MNDFKEQEYLKRRIFSDMVIAGLVSLFCSAIIILSSHYSIHKTNSTSVNLIKETNYNK